MEEVNVLQAIQSKLKAPKNQYNSFGKYKYRSQEDILEALKPLLAEHECSLTITDEIRLVGDRYYVRAAVTLWKAGNPIETTTAFAREADTIKGMSDSQITGATSSYARKYALNGMFLCDDTKDADALPPEGNGFITDKQLATIRDLIKKYKADEKKFLAYLKVESLEKIPSESYKTAIAALEAKAKKAQNDS